MRRKGRKDYMLRFWLLLLLVFAGTVGLYFLPEKIDTFEIKKVDMLSDIRIGDTVSIDLDSMGNAADNFIAQRAKKIKQLSPTDSVLQEEVEVAKRDSIYNKVKETRTDSSTQPFEDFSSSHRGLGRFFGALKRSKSLNRPVRIAVLGDSFIEGDIFTCDLRKSLQSIYGGGGVGWVPITSEVAGFRRTVKHTFSGWNTHNMLHQRGRYTASGYYFTPKEHNATVRYLLPGDSSKINTASLVSIYYTADKNVPAKLSINGASEEIELPVSSSVNDYKWSGSKCKSAKLTIYQPEGVSLLGMSLEQQHGVTVDNFSLRGNSGLILSKLDLDYSKRLNTLRPYDLVILQYGLNVANAKQSDYSSYVKQMSKVIAHVKACFPSADILIMGVSDRGVKTSEGFETMKTIYNFISAQQRIARDNGLVFWNTFLAMGGSGSMARLVMQGKAAKDYTHVGFPGGRIVANAFMKAFNFEKAYYDAI